MFEEEIKIESEKQIQQKAINDDDCVETQPENEASTQLPAGSDPKSETHAQTPSDNQNEAEKPETVLEIKYMKGINFKSLLYNLCFNDSNHYGSYKVLCIHENNPLISNNQCLDENQMKAVIYRGQDSPLSPQSFTNSIQEILPITIQQLYENEPITTSFKFCN